jgi:myo-inositol 2-dehydrogenase / D-chiro-inositol 1-dehydrogenase
MTQTAFTAPLAPCALGGRSFTPKAAQLSPGVAAQAPAVQRTRVPAHVRMVGANLPGIGVIGCGRIGQVHARTIAGLQDARLVAVADPFEEFGRRAAADYGTHWVADWQELIANPDIQGIVIGSPTPFHAEQIKAAAAAGKDIFCEKPISNDLRVIDECLAAVDAAGVRLLVGFQRRFDSNFMRVKAEVEAGAIGEVRMFHIVSRDPAPPPAEYLAKSGGIFLDMASHDFDMARFITGSEIEEVYVQGAAFEDAAKQAADLDTVITLIKMKNGTFGTIDNSRRCAYGYDQRIEVFGSKGSVTGGNKSPDSVVVAGPAGITAGLPYSFFMDRYTLAYAGAMTEFVTMIKNGTPPSVTGSDGRAPIVAGMAAAVSAKERRPVRLSEVDLSVIAV